VNTSVLGIIFLSGAAVSLISSWRLVSRVEALGHAFGVSEVLLGLMAAVGANAPEITSSISALDAHQPTIAAGVILGSNVFNLAALLGLGAIIAGGIGLHRRVLILEGTLAVALASLCLLTVLHALSAPWSLGLAVALFVLYCATIFLRRPQVSRQGLARILRWLDITISEEEEELQSSPVLASRQVRDVIELVLCLAIVVVASIVMEHSGSTLGTRWHVSSVVVGTLVLAAVTSLPNMVAAIYLVRHRRIAATLSTALNSNALNVLLGFLLPGTILGVGVTTAPTTLVAAWYLAFTLVIIVLATWRRGVGRAFGIAIVLSYGIFVGIMASDNIHPNRTQVILTIVAMFLVTAAAGWRKVLPTVSSEDRPLSE
jgi:cation:H+ antiporter